MFFKKNMEYLLEKHDLNSLHRPKKNNQKPNLTFYCTFLLYINRDIHDTSNLFRQVLNSPYSLGFPKLLSSVYFCMVRLTKIFIQLQKCAVVLWYDAVVGLIIIGFVVVVGVCRQVGFRTITLD